MSGGQDYDWEALDDDLYPRDIYEWGDDDPALQPATLPEPSTVDPRELDLTTASNATPASATWTTGQQWTGNMVSHVSET